MRFKILFILILFVLLSCYEGYFTKDGSLLTKYLSPVSLKELIENLDESIWLIDVRPSASYKAGHIPAAKSYPSSLILSKLNELPRDKYFILYCETGGRAQVVLKNLEKQGYTKMMNWGSYKRWIYDLIIE